MADRISEQFLLLFLSLRRQRRRLLGSTFVVFFQPVSSFPLFVVCHLSQKVIKVDRDLKEVNREFREVNRDLIEINRDLIKV